MKVTKNNMRGITLIALVVTIVVLLILAGITISSLTGEKGIIKEARSAKELSEKAALEEQVELAIIKAEQKYNNPTINNIIDELKNSKVISEPSQVKDNGDIYTDLGYVITGKLDEYIGKTSTGDNEGEGDIPSEDENVKLGEIVQITKKDNYKDDDGDTATVPQGFAIVPGCTDISEGLVISDIVNDTEHIGNQFVWVPVEVNNFKRMGGYRNKAAENLSDGITEPYIQDGYSSKEEGNTEIEEEAFMRSSVEKNGGFYIGRYEVGKDGNEIVVKKNKVSLYNVNWGKNLINIEVENGAVKLARNFVKTTYVDKGKTVGVNSTLVYGVQWDAVMQFMDRNYSNKTYDESSYVKNSSQKGWYKDNYNSTSTGNTVSNPNHITGLDLIYSDNPNIIMNKQKNIYDMAGNVYEWTMEASGNTTRICRGGDYRYDGCSATASCRYGISPGSSGGPIGFRVALYLES